MQRRIRPNSVNVDVPATELDDSAYSFVRNKYFKEQGSIRAEGYGDIFNAELLDSPLFVMYDRNKNGEDYWIYCGAESANLTNLTTHWPITPAGGMQISNVGDYCGTTLNSIFMLTNGKDAPWYWPGNTASPLTTLPDWPANTTCGFLRSFKYNAIAGDITENGVKYENQLYWSSSVAPGLPPQSWTPLPSNDAGDSILAQTPGALIDGAQIRDHFVIAKNHSLYLMAYTGGAFVFRFSSLSSTAGVMSRNCMTEHQGMLYLFSDGDILATDGAQIRSIASKRVRRTIFDEMDQTNIQQCFVTPYLAKDQIWFCYPTGGSAYANRAAIYTVTDDAWGFRDLPNLTHASAGIAYNYIYGTDWDNDEQSWNDDNTLWDQSGAQAIADGVIMASSDDEGHLYGVDFLGSANGVPINGVLEKSSMDFGDYDKIKLIQAVYPNILGEPGTQLKVRIGVQQQDTDSVTWSDVADYIIGQTSRITCTEAGRLISIQIEGDSMNRWRCYSIEFEFAMSGRF